MQEKYAASHSNHLQMKSSKEARKIPYLIVRLEDGATPWLQCSWKIKSISPSSKWFEMLLNLTFNSTQVRHVLNSFQFQQAAPSDGGAGAQAPSLTPGKQDPRMGGRGRTLRRIDGLISPLPCSLPPSGPSDLVRSDLNFPAVTRPLRGGDGRRGRGRTEE